MRASESYAKASSAATAYYATVLALGEVMRRVAEDARDYVLDGDANAAPPESIRKAFAVMETEEATKVVAKVAAAIASGAARGQSARGDAGDRGGGESGTSARGDNLMESMLDVLLEPKRLRRVSELVGETSRSVFGALASVVKDNADIVRAFAGYEDRDEQDCSSSRVEKPSAAERAVAFLEEPRNKDAIVGVGRELIDAAVSTYVRELGDDNMYSDIFEAVRNPENKAVFLEMMRAMVEVSVRTYVVASTEAMVHPESAMLTPRLGKRDDSPTSPLASRFAAAASTPMTPRSVDINERVEHEIHSPHLMGTWRELFAAATETNESRRFALATTVTATRAALSGLASGVYEIIFTGKFAGHKFYIQSWALAIIFAMCSIALWIFLRILSMYALLRVPT